MEKAKIEHMVIRNEKLFCMNCGDSQAIPFPIAIPVFSAMSTAFEKMHAKCRKTWQAPIVDPSWSADRKAGFWWENGERGRSSEVMWYALQGRLDTHRGAHPLDPDDFRRCYLLIKTVPEWKERLVFLKPLSTSWSNLVDNWDKLTDMLEEQMRTKKDNGMYDLMQKLINQ